MPDMDICFVKLCSLSVCGDFCRGVDPGEGATPAPTRAEEIAMSRRVHRNILAVTPWQRDKPSASAVPPPPEPEKMPHAPDPETPAGARSHRAPARPTPVVGRSGGATRR